MMEIGTKEWFEKLNEMVNFPANFAFYYNKRDNVIQVSKVDSKAKAENVRYKDIEPTPLRFHPKETALIKVKNISSDQEYYEELVRLQEMWVTKEVEQQEEYSKSKLRSMGVTLKG